MSQYASIYIRKITAMNVYDQITPNIHVRRQLADTLHANVLNPRWAEGSTEIFPFELNEATSSVNAHFN